ncbi:hypothetical protein N0V90_001726 [Kalmusia sp. IMI 367209]|nr:hypothetical protein N0V90_001726 [Kalmusia sp. IMI 367209]
MRYSPTVLSILLTAVQALSSVQFPTVAVLPIQGVADVTAGNGFNSIATSLLSSAQGVSIQADSISLANAKLGASGSAAAGAGANLPSIDVARAIQNATNTFWQTTADVEMKVCSVVLSINQQNIATQQANLVAGINAQAQVILKLAASIQATISKVQDQVTAFTDSEKAIVAAAIASALASAQASVVPIANLSDGLKAAGLVGFADAVSSLQGSVAALASTAAKVNFGVSH